MSEPQQSARPLVENQKTVPREAGGGQAYDLTRFTLADMVRCGAALRMLAGNAASMEEAAQLITRYLYDNLRGTASSERCCALVRLFKTEPYANLSDELRRRADSMAGGACRSPDTRCLSLLASAGDNPQWNSRRTSKGHQCIPLASEAMVERFPMIAQLIRQLGLSTAEFLGTAPEIIRDLEQSTFGVFHVPVASGSPFIPAQKDFVAPYGIQSVLGCGGLLDAGELFALIMFARVAIPGATADMFRTIALNLKLGFAGLLDKPVFADRQDGGGNG